jgi:hypothetical protein
MGLRQFKLDRSVLQSRGIFNKYVYEPDNGDTKADVVATGYFSQSRYVGEDGWIGGLIECNLADGYVVLRVLSDGISAEEILSGTGGEGARFMPFSDVFTEVGHGFALGNAIYSDGSNYLKAIATSDATSNVLGIVSKVIDADNFRLVFGGLVTFGPPLTSFTPGDTWYLSDTVAGRS